MASYYVWSGAGGSANGSSWANAFTTLTLAFVAEAAGDTLYVAHDHSESTATAITLTSSGTVSNPTKIVCVNRAGSVPPVSADIRATAQVATTVSSNINFAGCAHYDGIIFNCGNGSGSPNINIPNVSGNLTNRFDNCSMRFGTTGASKLYIAANTGAGTGCYVEFNNTTLGCSATGQAIVIGGVFKWRNTPNALINTIPVEVFGALPSSGGSLECIGVDLSAAGSGKVIVEADAAAKGISYRFVDCKLDAAVTKSQVPLGLGSTEVDFIRSGAGGVNYTVHRHRFNGLLTEEATIVRTGGASDGTTTIAWQIDTTANCNYSTPFECPPIAVWNATTGSAVTATVEGVWGGGAVPLDDDVWLEVEYLGDAASPMGSFVNDGKANLLVTAANQTSSSETWGGSTTKFKLNVTFTPQQAGWIYARVKCAKVSSTFYIDPLVTLS